MHIFPVCKALSINDVGVLRDTVFMDIPPGVGFQTGYLVKQKLGGLPQDDTQEKNGALGRPLRCTGEMLNRKSCLGAQRSSRVDTGDPWEAGQGIG